MIKNDLPLLDQMMIDLSKYDTILGPGPYWLANQENTLKWLQENDLNAFRTYNPSNKALGNFSGNACWPNLKDRVAISKSVERSFIYRLCRKLRISPIQTRFDKFCRDQTLPTRIVTLYAQAASRLISLCDTRGDFEKLEFFLEDGPSDIVCIQGKQLTPISAEKFLLYCRIMSSIDTEEFSTVVEVGPGAGQLNEIISKLHPMCKQFLIDIPPQLYVTEAFMTAIFGKDVMPYTESSQCTDFTQLGYRIYPIAPWMAEQAKFPKVDLFLSQVFEEMAHETVAGYMDLARSWESKYIVVSTILKKHGSEVFSPEQYQSALPDYDLLVSRKSNPDALPFASGETNPSYDLVFKRSA